MLVEVKWRHHANCLLLFKLLHFQFKRNGAIAHG